MKKILLAFLLFVSICAAQSVPTTPNIGLYVPAHGQQNWDTYLNNNFVLLDGIFGGTANVPSLSITHGLSFAGGSTIIPFNTNGIELLNGSTFATMFLNDDPSALTGSAQLSYQNASSQGGFFAATNRTTDQTCLSHTYSNGGWYTASYSVGGLGFTENLCGDRTGVYSNGLLDTASFMIPPQAFASLPTCAAGIEGEQASVNNSTTNSQGATITGGGTNHVEAYCNGTNWVVVSGTGGGGAGISGATANGAVYATSSTAATSTVAMTDGQVLVGSSTGIPANATLTQGSGITVTNGHNTITIAATTSIASATSNGAMYATGASSGTSTGAMTDGQLLIGDSTGAPQLNTITAGTGVTVTGGHHTITLATTGTGYVGTNTQTANYTAVSGDSGKLVIMNCTSACQFTLFASPTSNYKVGVLSIGSTLATVSLNGKNFNGASAAVTLNSFEPVDFISDGTNYFGRPPLVAGSGTSLTGASNGLTFTSGTAQTGVWFQMSTGSSGTAPVSSANNTYISSFIPVSTFSAGHMVVNVSTADNSANLYDFGIYNAAGTLMCHTGALTGSTSFATTGLKNLAFISACNLVGGTRYNFAATGNATTLALMFTATGAVVVALNHTVVSTGGTTSGGVLNSSVTIPTDSYGAGVYPNVVFNP